MSCYTYSTSSDQLIYLVKENIFFILLQILKYCILVGFILS